MSDDDSHACAVEPLVLKYGIITIPYTLIDDYISTPRLYKDGKISYLP